MKPPGKAYRNRLLRYCHPQKHHHYRSLATRVLRTSAIAGCVLHDVNLACHVLRALKTNKAPGASDDRIGATQATILHSYQPCKFAQVFYNSIWCHSFIGNLGKVKSHRSWPLMKWLEKSCSATLKGTKYYTACCKYESTCIQKRKKNTRMHHINVEATAQFCCLQRQKLA